MLKLTSSFQLLNEICAYGNVLYELTCTLMSKNVNNDISKDWPITIMVFDSKHYETSCLCSLSEKEIHVYIIIVVIAR